MRLTGRTRVINRCAENDAVKFVEPRCEFIDSVIEYTSSCFRAAAAGNASGNRLCAYLIDFSVNSVFIERFGNLTQRRVGTAVCMRTAVNKYTFILSSS